MRSGGDGGPVLRAGAVRMLTWSAAASVRRAQRHRAAAAAFRALRSASSKGIVTSSM